MNQSSNLAVNTLLTDQVRQVAGTACEPIDAWLEAHRQELVRVRRHLHMHPEPSGRERETTSYLAQRLDEVGVTATVLRDGLGLVADAVIGDPGPDAARVALRADIDALKIQDAKSVEYRSRCDGVMHACGHDVHSSIVLGIARAVAGQADDVQLEPGRGMYLRYLFQPAEEICQGAQWLVEQGVLEGVDAILGLHVDPENPAGQFGVRYGPLTAVCHEVAISVRGQGGHAARPHQSRDPLAAAISLASTLYSQLPRGVDSRQPSVFSIGR
ncbi:MAG: amidohydrolase, partial [Planctomycetota bacterium]|nr:amidohydrolase [Planctomycetota bacterium]